MAKKETPEETPVLVEQKPSCGRIVHYVISEPAQCRPLLVTDVNDDGSVNGVVFSTTGTHCAHEARQDEDKAVNTWHWPERV